MKYKKGFTLAEALLTMTVMGVVAALLIPTVVSDVRENANKAKAMALKVDLSGALSKMVMLENRINWTQYEQYNTRTNDPTGEFIVYHLMDYIKFAKICSPGPVDIRINPNANERPKPVDSGLTKFANATSKDIFPYKNHMYEISLKGILSQNAEAIKVDKDMLDKIANSYYDCDWAEGSVYRDYDLENSFSVFELADSAYISNAKNNPNVSAAISANLMAPWAVRTQNGISMLISYNPYCAESPLEYERQFNAPKGFIKSPACINIIYDVNGKTSPNVIGNDVGFATVFFGKSPKVTIPVFSANYDFSKNYSYEEAEKYCLDNSTSGNEGVPSAEEMMSMSINYRLLPSSVTGMQGSSYTQPGAEGIVFSYSPTDWTRFFFSGDDSSGKKFGQNGGVICTYR